MTHNIRPYRREGVVMGHFHWLPANLCHHGGCAVHQHPINWLWLYRRSNYISQRTYCNAYITIFGEAVGRLGCYWCIRLLTKITFYPWCRYMMNQPEFRRNLQIQHRTGWWVWYALWKNAGDSTNKHMNVDNHDILIYVAFVAPKFLSVD